MRGEWARDAHVGIGARLVEWAAVDGAEDAPVARCHREGDGEVGGRVARGDGLTAYVEELPPHKRHVLPIRHKGGACARMRRGASRDSRICAAEAPVCTVCVASRAPAASSASAVRLPGANATALKVAAPKKGSAVSLTCRLLTYSRRGAFSTHGSIDSRSQLAEASSRPRCGRWRWTWQRLGPKHGAASVRRGDVGSHHERSHKLSGFARPAQSATMPEAPPAAVPWSKPAHRNVPALKSRLSEKLSASARQDAASLLYVHRPRVVGLGGRVRAVIGVDAALGLAGGGLGRDERLGGMLLMPRIKKGPTRCDMP